MTSPEPSGDAVSPAPETERMPVASHAEHTASRDQRARAIAVLDEPLDDDELGDRLRRPGLSRSTTLLLALLGVVVVFGAGTLVGRTTAPDTGPGSSPDVVGTVESVTAGRVGASRITVRTVDGQLSVLDATAGTPVSVPRAGGLGGLRAGERVTVAAEVNGVGGLDATHVDVAGGP